MTLYCVSQILKKGQIVKSTEHMGETQTRRHAECYSFYNAVTSLMPTCADKEVEERE